LPASTSARARLRDSTNPRSTRSWSSRTRGGFAGLTPLSWHSALHPGSPGVTGEPPTEPVRTPVQRTRSWAATAIHAPADSNGKRQDGTRRCCRLWRRDPRSATTNFERRALDVWPKGLESGSALAKPLCRRMFRRKGRSVPRPAPPDPRRRQEVGTCRRPGSTRRADSVSRTCSASPGASSRSTRRRSATDP